MSTLLDTLPALEPHLRLTKDQRAAAKTMSIDEVRFLVNLFYKLQDDRIKSDNQERSLVKSEQPHEVLAFFASQFTNLENDAQKALDSYSNSTPVGQWARSICGIGPVIAAGLLAHIDISKAPTVGHIWSYSGISGPKHDYEGRPTDYNGRPTKLQLWTKGQKRPWNAELKTLCYKISDSFVKVSNNPNDVYGKIYAARKVLEIQRNEAGEFKTQAAAKLANYKIGKDTEAYGYYSIGKLPPAHIDARARRYAVKLFLSHLHYVMYECYYGVPPPTPYILTKGNHAHFMAPPNWPMAK